MTTLIPTGTKVTGHLSAQTRDLFKVLGFKPTEGQTEFLACKKPFVLVLGGFQSGKSVGLSAKFIDSWQDDCKYWNKMMPESRRYGDGIHEPLIYWLVGETYDQTEKEFYYIIDHLRSLGFDPQHGKRIDPGYIEIKFPERVDSETGERNETKPRLRITTKSAKDITKLSRESPHGIMMCEAGQISLNAYNICRGRVTPNNAWLFMSGTIEKSQLWYPQLGDTWEHGFADRQSFRLSTPSNTYLFPEGVDDPGLKALKTEVSDEYWLERIEGKSVPPEGLIFTVRTDIHVRDVQYIPGERVLILEDPGYSAASPHVLEIAHMINERLQVFDEIYLSGYITREIIDICKNREWWKEIENNNIWLCTDPHYKDAHHSMGSVAEEWRKETRLVTRGERARGVKIEDLDMRLKDILKPNPITGDPRIVFSPRCQGILSEFGLGVHPLSGMVQVYRFDTNTLQPIKTNNHGIRAIEYGIVELMGLGYGGKKTATTRRWGESRTSRIKREKW